MLEEELWGRVTSGAELQIKLVWSLSSAWSAADRRSWVTPSETLPSERPTSSFSAGRAQTSLISTKANLLMTWNVTFSFLFLVLLFLTLILIVLQCTQFVGIVWKNVINSLLSSLLILFIILCIYTLKKSWCKQLKICKGLIRGVLCDRTGFKRAETAAETV